MASIVRAVAAAALAVTLTGTSAIGFCCGITEDTVRHETTRDIHVWAPFAGPLEPRPIVYAMHGTGVDYGGDWDVIGSELAKQGVVVFAPDYHASDWQVPRWDRVTQELECGYRYALAIADEYSASPAGPVIYVGHSIGGTNAVAGALDTTRFVPGGSYDTCFEGVERPDAAIALGSCFYEHDGVDIAFDAAAYGDGDARLILAGGSEDQVCPARQSREAAAAFDGTGYDATYVEIEGANHMRLIGHDIVDGEFTTVEDDPAVQAVVRLILDTIEGIPGA